ncbi:MAG: ABC transporter ATP-binding protein [Pseudohongiella sp.]|nr:ABC transporter ATP-binding protein [Pseudohongiella sp.]
MTAVDNVSLQIPSGEIYGLVGPNGAGKTSLLKMLAKLISPTYGELFIGGINLAEYPRQAYKNIGYMPDLSPVAPELKVWEFLEFFAASYGIPKSKRKARVDECLQQVQMAEHSNAFGKSLSRGMMQRVVLAKTLIPNPKVLLLDEPASGMDPIARINLKNILLELCAEGVTVVISSHILTELADMCTSMGIMNKGKLLRSGPLEDMLHTRLVNTIYLDAIAGLDTIASILEQSEFVADVVIKGSAFIIEFTGDVEDEAALLRKLILADIKVISFSKLAATMEDTLIELVSPDDFSHRIESDEFQERTE